MKLAGNSPVQIYVNKMKNRIVFTIKTDYKLELFINRRNNAIIWKFKKRY